MATYLCKMGSSKFKYVCLSIGMTWMVSCTINEQALVTTQVEDQAKVIDVECKGQPNNYTLDVTIESPDLGCEQYADWWEVLTQDSVLIYRRILTHSHVDEQPFARSGGIVNVGADDFIYVRAHMNNLGYGSQVFSGNVREGLQIDTIDSNFALSVSEQDPLPQNCAF